MTDNPTQVCGSCYGQGIGGSDLRPCPDCAGLGQLPSGLVLAERRLRELEQSYGQRGGEVAQDMLWLVTEVRRAHHALLQILAAGQDVEADAIATKIKFLANDVLRVYPARPV
jgi:hypothetical protein